MVDTQDYPMKVGEPACHFQKWQGCGWLIDAGCASGREGIHHNSFITAFHLSVT